MGASARFAIVGITALRAEIAALSIRMIRLPTDLVQR